MNSTHFYAYSVCDFLNNRFLLQHNCKYRMDIPPHVFFLVFLQVAFSRCWIFAFITVKQCSKMSTFFVSVQTTQKGWNICTLIKWISTPSCLLSLWILRYPIPVALYSHWLHLKRIPICWLSICVFRLVTRLAT